MCSHSGRKSKRVPPAGFEPTTSGLGNQRSIQLSYGSRRGLDLAGMLLELGREFLFIWEKRRDVCASQRVGGDSGRGGPRQCRRFLRICRGDACCREPLTKRQQTTISEKSPTIQTHTPAGHGVLSRVHLPIGGILPPLPRERQQSRQRTRCGGED